jgi:single-strand DNA-binding protein
MNKVILIGNLGNDPETKHLPSGMQVSNFSLATSETYKKDGEKVTETTWHNCTAFGKLSEIVEKFFIKGMKVLVEGRIKQESWDKEGVKQYKTIILMNSFEFVQDKQDATKPKPQPESERVPTGKDEEDFDDLPF